MVQTQKLHTLALFQSYAEFFFCQLHCSKGYQLWQIRFLNVNVNFLDMQLLVAYILNWFAVLKEIPTSNVFFFDGLLLASVELEIHWGITHRWDPLRTAPGVLAEGISPVGQT